MFKVAFVAAFSSASVHRKLRGALNYADAHSKAVIRDFRLPIDFNNCPGLAGIIGQLWDWHPDGILSCLDQEQVQRVLASVPRPCPLVNMLAAQLRPGMAVVGGSARRYFEVAVQHLRQQGLRSLALLLLEDIGASQFVIKSFNEVARPADPSQAILFHYTSNALLTDPEAPVEPVPKKIAAWLRRLPKPVGILCPNLGGGNYLIRICHALGLRVPEDVAVICTDDVDWCLASKPTLTSVVPAHEIIGFEAMKLLDQMMNGLPAPDKAVLVEAADLHVRESTGLKRAEICDIAAAVSYINQHACHGLTVERLLRETQHVSKITFRKHFQAATGLAPGETIRQRQFEEARRLLATTRLSITLVAEQSGFGSSSDFARAFRAAQGISPSDYRKQASPPPKTG